MKEVTISRVVLLTRNTDIRRLMMMIGISRSIRETVSDVESRPGSYVTTAVETKVDQRERKDVDEGLFLTDSNGSLLPF